MEYIVKVQTEVVFLPGLHRNQSQLVLRVLLSNTLRLLLSLLMQAGGSILHRGLRSHFNSYMLLFPLQKGALQVSPGLEVLACVLPNS